VSVTSEEAEYIRALDWCPGPVVFPLQLYLLTPYKQRQLILQIWDILHNDFLLVSEMSSVDLNRSEAPYHSGRGFGGIISDNAALYSHRDAHRFIPRGDLVAMVVRSAGHVRCWMAARDTADGS